MNWKKLLSFSGRAAVVLLLAVGLVWAEHHSAAAFFKGITPFPYGDYLERLVNALLRDAFLAALAGLLWYRRKRIPDRLWRYEPAVVLGVVYLAFAAYICAKMALDPFFLTALAIPAGLMNNVVLVLLAAVAYHRHPIRRNAVLYFVVYWVSGIIMLTDILYFWQTSMHVQGVFFRNFNIYSIEGIFASFSRTDVAAIAAFVAFLCLAFRLPGPRRHKPNTPWALLVVLGYTVGFNLLYLTGSQLGLFALHGSGLWSEEQVEKSRREFRDLLVTPIVPNFIGKAIFKKEKNQLKTARKAKTLTDQDKRLLHGLGLLRREPFVVRRDPAYDRVVLIILESVHRDFLHYYNPKHIPAEATPYLDRLVRTYPHLDHYYSSAIPTTEGLNATFRSQLLFDGDVDGRDKPSLFRSVQAHGYEGYFQSASSRYYNSEFREYTEQFGMAHYEAREDLEKAGYTGASGWGFHNDQMYARMLEQLKKLRGRRYVYVTKTLDMHQPYPYYATKWEDTPESFRNNPIVTIHGIHWVDRTLEKFFTDAAREGLWDDRTLFIITSDHNPHSGGEYTKLVDNPADRQSIAPIPLLFVAKNVEPLQFLNRSAYASQIDLAPTLLCLLGIEPPRRFLGRNLLQTYLEPDNALGFFGNKAYYFSRTRRFVDKIDEPYPAHDYEDSLANYVLYSYYRNSLPWKGDAEL
ncbi:MAG: sulfatase-like hydrolase/transferase [Succiniclasticum sp.]|nr:sulfatase-like hydrolase/transferase [Succiniclasticum sp.]